MWQPRNGKTFNIDNSGESMCPTPVSLGLDTYRLYIDARKENSDSVITKEMFYDNCVQIKLNFKL